MNDDNTENAFRCAAYDVALDESWWTLKIGEPCPAAIQSWLRTHAGAAPAWLVTAHNPGAQRLAADDNEVRDAVLRDWANHHAQACLATVNRDPHDDWPDEPGLLIAGVDEGLARTLARRLGQLAMVAVHAENPTELVWLTS